MYTPVISCPRNIARYHFYFYPYVISFIVWAIKIIPKLNQMPCAHQAEITEFSVTSKSALFLVGNQFRRKSYPHKMQIQACYNWVDRQTIGFALDKPCHFQKQTRQETERKWKSRTERHDITGRKWTVIIQGWRLLKCHSIIESADPRSNYGSMFSIVNEGCWSCWAIYSL